MSDRKDHGAKTLNQERGTIIFDLDGTLVDSAPDLADALDALLVETGFAAIGLDATRKLIGHGISNLVLKGFAVCGKHLNQAEASVATQRFQALYAERLPAKATLYPMVTEILSHLSSHGWRMVVCTNKLEAFARPILEGLGIAHYFEIIAGPDTFGVAKPDPQHLLRTLPPHVPESYLSIMVGDSEVDIATAKAAGLPVVAVTYGYAHTLLNTLAPDALVDRFSDVPAAIADLANKFALIHGRNEADILASLRH